MHARITKYAQHGVHQFYTKRRPWFTLSAKVSSHGYSNRENSIIDNRCTLGCLCCPKVEVDGIPSAYGISHTTCGIWHAAGGIWHVSGHEGRGNGLWTARRDDLIGNRICHIDRIPWPVKQPEREKEQRWSGARLRITGRPFSRCPLRVFRKTKETLKLKGVHRVGGQRGNYKGHHCCREGFQGWPILD